MNNLKLKLYIINITLFGKTNNLEINNSKRIYKGKNTNLQFVAILLALRYKHIQKKRGVQVDVTLL